MKRSLITGITGQDGSYIAELLLGKGYEVYGLIRRTSNIDYSRLKNVYSDIRFICGDLSDSSSIDEAIKTAKPDEIYNFAAQSNVAISFDIPENTADINAIGVIRILESIRKNDLAGVTKIYQASSSELFGKANSSPQNENTPFHPYSPYAISKLFAYWTCKEYREIYNMFICNGILYNHESERRGKDFVTKKITLAVSNIKKGLQDKLYLGNLNSKRDWGYAKDYVECMWKMLQKEKPDDYVVATGVQHTVREFATLAFGVAGYDIEWDGEGVNEKGIDRNSGKTLVEVSKDFYRKDDVNYLIGDPSKAIKELGFNPTKTSFDELVRIMVNYDLNN